MLHRSVIVATIALTATLLAAPIDFTPLYETSLEDGTPLRMLTFTCEGRKIVYRPMPKWQVSGDAGGITLIPNEPAEARATIANAAPGLPAAFDEAGLQAYRRVAAGMMPRSVDATETPTERLDPVAVNDWHSWEFACAYTLAGRKFARSICFIKLDAAREIAVTVDARAEDFEKFRDAVHASLGSWWERPAN